MGNTCIPVADHVDIWQNQYNIVKLKNIKNIHKEKNLQVIQRKKNHIIYKDGYAGWEILLCEGILAYFLMFKFDKKSSILDPCNNGLWEEA